VRLKTPEPRDPHALDERRLGVFLLQGSLRLNRHELIAPRCAREVGGTRFRLRGSHPKMLCISGTPTLAALTPAKRLKL
jgi:hypothetical protein